MLVVGDNQFPRYNNKIPKTRSARSDFVPHSNVSVVRRPQETMSSSLLAMRHRIENCSRSRMGGWDMAPKIGLTPEWHRNAPSRSCKGNNLVSCPLCLVKDTDNYKAEQVQM